MVRTRKPLEKEMVNRESSDWYERCIEEPLRGLVHHLRNNGINTECSCAHDSPMYIQCQYLLDGEIQRIHELVWAYLSENGKPVEFDIKVRHQVRDGHRAITSIDIEFPNHDPDHIAFWDRMRRYHLQQAKRYADDIAREKRLRRCNKNRQDKVK